MTATAYLGEWVTDHGTKVVRLFDSVRRWSKFSNRAFLRATGPTP